MWAAAEHIFSIRTAPFAREKERKAPNTPSVTSPARPKNANPTNPKGSRLAGLRRSRLLPLQAEPPPRCLPGIPRDWHVNQTDFSPFA